jgi:hypothetical protein
MPTFRRASLLVVALALPAAVRATDVRNGRAHPELAARLAGIHRVGVVPPEVKVFELTSGNQPVLNEKWTEGFRKAVTASVANALRSRRVEPVPFEPAAAEAKAELAEVSQLYDAVVTAAIQATVANRFPAKLARFEYPLGDLTPLLEPAGLDALVFTWGNGVSSSGGRKALQTLSAILVGTASSGIDRLVVGVVDRRGDLLWLGTIASTGYDMRDPASVESFVANLTKDLPAAKPGEAAK